MCDDKGNELSTSHVLSHGQVVCIRCDLQAGDAAMEPAVVPVSTIESNNTSTCPVTREYVREAISPTAEWTCPAHEIAQDFGPTDVG